MAKRPWSDLIPEDEQRAYRAAGFGRPSSWGKRPGLLIIDVQYRTIGTERKPFWESIKEFPTSTGEVGWKAMDNIVPLLALFREKGWPVLYPHVAPKVAHEGGRLAEKVPEIMNIPMKGYEFPKEIAPHPKDVLVPKKHPSAFFGTALCSNLIDLGVDTVVVTGCTTSGCVRGSVVDAFSYNFRTVVPEECVYDRSQVSHAVNLFDIGEKYADVLPVAEVMDRLRKI